MQLRRQPELRHNAQFLVHGAVFLLVSLTLVGCSGTPSNSTASRRPVLTSSSCDTPPGVLSLARVMGPPVCHEYGTGVSGCRAVW
jgi:hypothetical protein